ncbi:hypothetical protein ATO13_22696 [Stappia sp. 22II-S9-Z10]|nr:hypothetical protein ATO13_22696 [Stappia sp. 22II-S9-Z10]
MTERMNHFVASFLTALFSPRAVQLIATGIVSVFLAVIGTLNLAPEKPPISSTPTADGQISRIQERLAKQEEVLNTMVGVLKDVDQHELKIDRLTERQREILISLGILEGMVHGRRLYGREGKEQ